MKRKWYIVFIISSIVIIVLIYNITSYYYSYKKDLEFKERIAGYDFEKLKEINSDVVGYIGNAFLPGAYAISYFTDGGGDKCEITLDSTGAIKEIVVGYSYLDSQGFPLSRDFSMQFVNIGKTTIPEWVEG